MSLLSSLPLMHSAYTCICENNRKWFIYFFSNLEIAEVHNHKSSSITDLAICLMEIVDMTSQAQEKLCKRQFCLHSYTSMYIFMFISIANSMLIYSVQVTVTGPPFEYGLNRHRPTYIYYYYHHCHLFSLIVTKIGVCTNLQVLSRIESICSNKSILLRQRICLLAQDKLECPVTHL